MSFGTVPAEVHDPTSFSFRVRTTIKPHTSGLHALSLASIGPAELYIDGTRQLKQSGDFEEKGSLFFTYGSEETITSMNFVAGLEYQVEIRYQSHGRQHNPKLFSSLDPMEDQFQGIRFGFEEVDSSDRPTEAARLASACDAAIVVVGRDKEWESEGQDILSFDLPGEQVRLIREVAATCKRTIVVVQAGTPVNMEPWIHEVQGVLYTWYQGQELGNAAAAVICGTVNPSGRLPVTFPKRIEDCPAFSSFPGEANEIEYTEGVFVGYRWWDLLNIEPLFPLGFGLSFNEFEITAGSINTVSLTSITSQLVAKVIVTNKGGSNIPGRETVIAWFSQRSPAKLKRPRKQICGFAKSQPLLPGQSEEVELRIDPHAFGMFDPVRHEWMIDANAELEIMLGTTASNAMPAWRVSVANEIVWLR